jgi:hypothetical protein
MASKPTRKKVIKPTRPTKPAPLPNPLPAPMHQAGGRLMLASQLSRREVNWLVPELVPRDELTLVCGDTGAGKSTFYAAVMAQVTAGVMVAGGERSPPSHAVYLGRESDLHGRMYDLGEAAGVDLARVTCADLLAGDREAPLIHLPERMAQLDAIVKGEGATLLVIDPVKSYLSPGVSDLDGMLVRAVLEGVQHTARKNGCAVLGTAHYRKSRMGHPADWIAGSREWSQVPRQLIALGRDPRDEDRRLIAVLKAIAGREPPARSFRLEETGAAVRFKLGPACGVSAADMGAQLDTEVDRMTRADARTYLRAVLEAGEKSASSLLENAEKSGIKKHTLQRAKIDLGVESALVGNAGEQYWVWRKPEQWPAERS